MSLRLVTPPENYPVSIVEAKAYLREDSSDQDVVLQSLIASATEFVQSFCQRRYITQTMEWVLPQFTGCIRLPLAPVDPSDGIVFIKYTDEQGDVRTVDPSVYTVIGDGPSVSIFPSIGNIWPIAWPSSEPVLIRFTAGTDVAHVPPNVKLAVLQLISHWYDNREAALLGPSMQPFDMPFGISSLMMSEVWS